MVSPCCLLSRSLLYTATSTPLPTFVRYFICILVFDVQRMFSTFVPITLLATVLFFASAGAMPLPEVSEVAERDLEARSVTLLSAASISNFTPFTQFARAAYCPQSKVKTWNCGGK